jgi:hypothetical protein
MAEQLDEQAAEINTLSPDQMILALQIADARWNKKTGYRGSYNGSSDSYVRSEYRKKQFTDLTETETETLRSRGISYGTAKLNARIIVSELFAKLDVAHSLDWIAGGNGKIAGMRNRTINRSIGTQWNARGTVGKVTRREQLRAEAVRAQTNGAERMEVKLEPCT